MQQCRIRKEEDIVAGAEFERAVLDEQNVAAIPDADGGGISKEDPSVVESDDKRFGVSFGDFEVHAHGHEIGHCKFEGLASDDVGRPTNVLADGHHIFERT